VNVDLDAPGKVLDYFHVTPACPMFARRSYDDNVRRLSAAEAS
jgi:hypothetical protein